jgi:hypothetical protein
MGLPSASITTVDKIRFARLPVGEGTTSQILVEQVAVCGEDTNIPISEFGTPCSQK